MRFLLIVSAALLSAAVADAQSIGVLLEFPNQLDFMTPGARTLATGGVSAPVASDGASALANPAALTALTRPVVFVTGNASSITSVALFSGRLTGVPSGQGIDVGGPVYSNVPDRRTAASHFSIVVPVWRFRVAAFRDALLDMHEDIATQGVLLNFPNTTSSNPGGLPGDSREFGYAGQTDMSVTASGAAMAARIGSHVSLGLSVFAQHVLLHSEVRSYGTTIYGPADFTRSISSPFDQQANATKIGTNVGGAWTTGRLVVGGAVSRMPAVAFTQTGRSGIPVILNTWRLKLPDTIAGGAALHLTTRTTVMGEYRLVRYSQLADSYALAVLKSTSARPQDSWHIRDSAQLRGGIEHTWPSRMPLTIRGGAWYDPAHGVTFASGATDPISQMFAAMFPSRSSRVHATGGIGTAAFSSRVVIDVGADMATRYRVFAVSAGARW